MKYTIYLSAILLPISIVLSKTPIEEERRRRLEPHNFIAEPGIMELSDKVIVKISSTKYLRSLGRTEEQITQTQQAAREELGRYNSIQLEGNLHVVEIPSGYDDQTFADMLMTNGFLFEYVEPDWVTYPAGCPNDEHFGEQWHHENMQSCDAWEFETGDPDVVIAICDTGVETSHPDLGHRELGYNAVDELWEYEGGEIGPSQPHGTQVAGCAAAVGNNEEGVSGVGWNLSYRPMRVSNLYSGVSSVSVLTHAALTSIKAGDKVASVSYSGVSNQAVRDTATIIKDDYGGLLVWAADNGKNTWDWGDRDNDDVVVVGATDQNDALWEKSSRGRSVDLVAPGVDIYTTDTGAGYVSVTGTSYATPLVAGLIALIWSEFPHLTADQVECFVKKGCDDLGPAGVDDIFGYGRINSYETFNEVIGTENAVTGFTLIDTVRGYEARSLNDGDVITMPFYNIVAKTNPCATAEVEFYLDDKKFNIESRAPFSLCDDYDKIPDYTMTPPRTTVDYWHCSIPNGVHHLTAVPYSGGEQGRALYIQFTVDSPWPCTYCSDKRTNWMKRNRKQCGDSWFKKYNRCNDSYWSDNKYCQASCQKYEGVKYDGEVCCTPPGKPPYGVDQGSE